MALLTPLDVARRIASVAGIVILIALALAFLWRVYLHHHQADPYEREEPVTVELDTSFRNSVKITSGFALNYSPTDNCKCGTSGAISEVGRKQIT